MIHIEEVRRADQRRRFHELGRVLFAAEPRWAPVLRTYEAWLFERRHPYRQRADVVRFLARRGGDVVGRLCAHHIEGEADGWFGAFECADDPTAVAALLEAAADWAVERGAHRLAGPATFTLADEAGVLVEGFDNPGGTGRPWHPRWYAEHLAAAGLRPVDRQFPRWRLAAGGPGRTDLVERGPLPPQAGKLADRRLVLEGQPGAVAAVPDIAAGLRTTSVRQARRRVGATTEAAVVRIQGDEAALVMGLLGAADAAGYHHVWAPWCPDDRPPDTIHQVLGRNLR